MLEASAQTLSLPNLGRYIEAQIREGRDATRFQALYHSRLAEPLTVLLFALLAIPLALAIEQSRSLATSALYGIVILGNGELEAALTVKAHRFSKSAVAKIEAAGGTAEVIDVKPGTAE